MMHWLREGLRWLSALIRFGLTGAGIYSCYLGQVAFGGNSQSTAFQQYGIGLGMILLCRFLPAWKPSHPLEKGLKEEEITGGTPASPLQDPNPESRIPNPDLSQAGTPALPPWRLPRSAEWLAVLAILGVASWLRFAHLNEVPPGFYYDEAAHAWVAHQLGQGRTYPMFVHETNTTQLISWITVGWFRLFGESVAVLRSLSGFFGVMAVFLLYIYGKLLLGAPFGLTAAAFLTISRWHFNHSRIGWAENLMAVAAVLGVVYTIQRAIRTRGFRQIGWSLFGALITAVGLYGYTGFRPAVPFVLFLHVYLLLFKGFRRQWMGVLVFWIVLGSLMYPMGKFLEKDSHIFKKRTVEVFLFNNMEQASYQTLTGNIEEKGIVEGLKATDRGVYERLWRVLWANIQSHLVMCNWHGDNNARHNIPFQPLLPFWFSIAYVVGAAITLSRFWRFPEFTELVWLAGFLAPGYLTVESPHSLRTLCASPLVGLWTARTLMHCYEVVYPFLRKIGSGLVITAVMGVLFTLSLQSEYDTYFVKWPVRREVRIMFHCRITQIADFCRDHMRGAFIYGYNSDTDEVMFITGTNEGRINYGLNTIPSYLHPDTNAIFISYAERYDLRWQLEYFFPGVTHEFFEDKVLNEKTFSATRVSRQQILDLLGLKLEAFANEGLTGEPLGEVHILHPEQQPAEELNLPPEASWLKLSGSVHIQQPMNVAFRLGGTLPGWIKISGATAFEHRADGAVSSQAFKLPMGLFTFEMAVQRPPSGLLPVPEWQLEGGGFTPVPFTSFCVKPVPPHGLRIYLYKEDSGKLDLSWTRVDPYLDVACFDPPPFPHYQYQRAIWRGTLQAPESGVYFFWVETDSTLKILIDGLPVITTNRGGRYSATGKAHLEAGPHDFTIYFENMDVLRLKWRLPSWEGKHGEETIGEEYFTAAPFEPRPAGPYADLIPQ